MPRQPLEDLVVLDLSGNVATGYCGHLFAALGARVLDLELPGEGHPTRRLPPFAGNGAIGGESAFHAWIAAGKESVELDPRRPEGRARLLELVAIADVLLEDGAPGAAARAGLDRAALAAANPSLVQVSVPWYGAGGPLAEAPGGDALIASLIGSVRVSGRVEGPPMLPSGHGAQVVAGATAFIAALGDLIGRERGRAASGAVECPVLEANLALTEVGTVGLFNACAVPPRLGVNRYWPTYPAGIYRARDGWIGVTAVLFSQWKSLCELLDLPELAAEPRYQITIERMTDADLLDARLAPAIARFTVDELFHRGQAARIPIALVPTAADLLGCEQFRDRGAFASYELDGHGAFEAPGVPFRFERTPAAPGGRAPRLGAHAQLSRGGSSVPAAQLPSASDAGAAAAPSRPPALDLASPRRRPDLLAGIRVVDLTMGWAGPLAARHLADLGAEVVKVESCHRFDWWRGWDATPEGLANHIHERSSAFNSVNRNKLGVTLDLTTARGVELVKRLVEVSDVVVENYAATVLPKLGLGWEDLRAVHPDLVMLSMPPFGASGPWRGYRAYGSTVEHASGLPHLQGEEDGPPTMQHVALGDPIAGIYGAAALLAALWHRERTGEGQRIDLSHVEALFAMGVRGFLEQAIAGRPAARHGRRHPEAAPHGVFPCAGADQWITITVMDDDAWRTFAEWQAKAAVPVVWPSEERFATAAGRKAHEDELDRLLAEWTSIRDRDLLARKLQTLGVPAAPVHDVGEPLASPQLVARGFWQWLDRAWVGRQPNPSAPYRRAGAGPWGIDLVAPTLGEHNEAVLSGLLGLSTAEIERLRADGVIGDRPVYELAGAG